MPCRDFLLTSQLTRLDMKIIQNKIIPFGRGFLAINLFGILFAKGPCDKTVINHEEIHTAQMKELLYVPFYLLYIAEWMVKLLIYHNPIETYYNISFEREAYLNERNQEYLKHRKHFSSFRFIYRKN